MSIIDKILKHLEGGLLGNKGSCGLKIDGAQPDSVRVSETHSEEVSTYTVHRHNCWFHYVWTGGKCQ